MFLGSTYIDKQLLFSKLYSIQSPSYLWVDGWIKWEDIHHSQKQKLLFGSSDELGNITLDNVLVAIIKAELGGTFELSLTSQNGLEILRNGR